MFAAAPFGVHRMGEEFGFGETRVLNKKTPPSNIVDGGGFVDRFGGELPELDLC